MQSMPRAHCFVFQILEICRLATNNIIKNLTIYKFIYSFKSEAVFHLIWRGHATNMAPSSNSLINNSSHFVLLSQKIIKTPYLPIITFLNKVGVTLSYRRISKDTCPWYLGITWIQFGCGKDYFMPSPPIVYAGSIRS